MSSMIPATLAIASIWSPAASRIAPSAASSVMSAATGTISASANSAAKSSRRSCEMSTAITRPPSRATREAVARPIPEPAPVTMTVLPVNRPTLMRSTHSGRSTGAAVGVVSTAGAESAAANGEASTTPAGDGISPAATRRTSSSTSSGGNLPWLSLTRRLSASLRTGRRASAVWPPCARRSRRIGPPTASSSQVPTEESAERVVSVIRVVPFLSG